MLSFTFDFNIPLSQLIQDPIIFIGFLQQILQAALSSGDPILIQQVSKFLAILG